MPTIEEPKPKELTGEFTGACPVCGCKEFVQGKCKNCGWNAQGNKEKKR